MPVMSSGLRMSPPVSSLLAYLPAGIRAGRKTSEVGASSITGGGSGTSVISVVRC